MADPYPVTKLSTATWRTVQAENTPGWRQNIQRITDAGGVVVGNGAFRGNEFFVSATRTRVGRRNLTNEFPNRDKADTEDLGRRAPSYSLTAWVLEPGYFTRRNALLKALEQHGPGTLVHPFLGQKQVIVKDSEMTEDFDNGGMATFDLTFEEVRKQYQPAFTENLPQNIQDAADKAYSYIISPFYRHYNLVGPGYLVTAMMDLVRRLMRFYSAIMRAIPGPFDLSLVQEFIANVQSIYQNVRALVMGPQVLLQAIIDALFPINSLAIDAPDPIEAFNVTALLCQYDYNTILQPTPLPPIPGTTYWRLQEADNRLAFQKVARRVGLITTARLIAATPFTTTDQASYMREKFDQIAEPILLEVAEDEDEVFIAFTDMVTAVQRMLTSPGLLGTLATSERVNVPNATLSSLVLAYRKYGDINREQQILNLNYRNILSPAFLPGGKTLNLLSQ